MNKELQGLINRLSDHQEGCEDKCIDLQTLRFEAKEGVMRLYNESRSYYFKNDHKNPKDPKVTHAVRQFCSLAGVPYSFFIKNPEFMRNQIISCWLPTLKPEKAVILAKLRKIKDSGDYVIRAILPVEFANIANVDIFKIIGDAIGDSFRVEFIIGDGKDDLFLHVRFVSHDVFEAYGESCSTGFSVIVSELGAVPLSVETFLFRNTSKASMLATYGGEPFFRSCYEGIQPSMLEELFPRLMKIMVDQLPYIKSRIHEAKLEVIQEENVDLLLKALRLKKGLNEKFHRLLFQEVKRNAVKNRWDFVNRMAILAKDFDLTSRIAIERAAGELAGLLFNKV